MVDPQERAPEHDVRLYSPMSSLLQRKALGSAIPSTDAGATGGTDEADALLAASRREPTTVATE
jgi:hypothetical protein